MVFRVAIWQLMPHNGIGSELCHIGYHNSLRGDGRRAMELSRGDYNATIWQVCDEFNDKTDAQTYVARQCNYIRSNNIINHGNARQQFNSPAKAVAQLLNLLN